MPVLSNQRHERFAQELAKGKSAIDAYVAAGYKADTGSASRLAGNASIRQRVAALQADIAERTVEKVSIARSDVIAELGKLGFAPVKDENIKASDKRAALLNLAQIEGWVVERHEHTGAGGGPIKHDLSGISDEQLALLEGILGGAAALARRGSGGDTAEGGKA